MKTSTHQQSHRQLCSIALSLLLFLPAVPVYAGGDSAAGGEFDLHLEEALAFQGSTFGLEADDEGEATQETYTDVGPRSVQEVSQQVSAQEAGPDPADQMRSKKGFGRWLKKHWYVPVLAAVAIGVAIGDDDSGDNDASGEDD